MHQPQRVERKIAGLVDLHGEDMGVWDRLPVPIVDHLDILDALAAFDAEVFRAQAQRAQRLDEMDVQHALPIGRVGGGTIDDFEKVDAVQLGCARTAARRSSSQQE